MRYRLTDYDLGYDQSNLSAPRLRVALWDLGLISPAAYDMTISEVIAQVVAASGGAVEITEED